MNRVLITGVSGCIGQAVVRWLRESGVEDVVGLTRSGLAEDLDCVKGDVADQAAVESAVVQVSPNRIIHLAALQTPDCQAQPMQGLAINVGGTENVLRAAARAGKLDRVVFASSGAVYGPRSCYLGDVVAETDFWKPPHLYGIWKIAGEGMMQAFHRETGIPSVSLRLATTYGPGRDRGLTAAPTSALKAAARKAAFSMPYQGREHYHFVEDVGAGFGASAVEEFSGYGVFNLRGRTVQVREFITLVNECAAELGIEGGPEIQIEKRAEDCPFVSDLSDAAILEAFPEMPCTGLKEGICRSLQFFRGELEAGRLPVEN